MAIDSAELAKSLFLRSVDLDLSVNLLGNHIMLTDWFAHIRFYVILHNVYKCCSPITSIFSGKNIFKCVKNSSNFNICDLNSNEFQDLFDIYIFC